MNDKWSRSGLLARAGRFEQLATRELELGSARLRRATFAGLRHPANASMTLNLRAAYALATVVAPQTHYPNWRIVTPPPARTLLLYFTAAQTRYGVPWEDLAAIE